MLLLFIFFNFRLNCKLKRILIKLLYRYHQNYQIMQKMRYTLL